MNGSTDSAREKRPAAPPALVGLLAMVLATVSVVVELAGAGWDPTVFAGFGEQDAPTRAFAEERLGEVILRPQLGHDGRFFFVQAHDPWVLAPETHAEILDRPLYRAQRILYPVLAGGLGLFESQTVVWAMIVVNVLAFGVGSWAVASIATSMGGSPWWGLAFLFNLGFVSELRVGGAGVVAGALAFCAVASLLRDRLAWSITLLTLAALCREVMLLAAVGCAWWLWSQRRRRDATLAGLIPIGAVAIWALYLRIRIDSLPAAGAVEDSLGLPLGGFVQAFSLWLHNPLDLIVGVAMLLLLGLFARRALLDRGLLAWAFLGYVPLALLLTEPVWHSYFDITRAVAPVLTAFVLLVVLSGRQTDRAGPNEQVFA